MSLIFFNNDINLNQLRQEEYILVEGDIAYLGGVCIIFVNWFKVFAAVH